jgi:23S rRNA pseudouridine2605 synthase
VADRLQKILSAAGVASRRHAEALIEAGRVTVNDVVVRTLGARADPARDVVAVDGERVAAGGPRRTLLLHKPRGVVSTVTDPEGRPTVRDLLAGHGVRLYPVGRLDLNSTGLLLLTDDGALAAALLHPRHALPRTYHAKVRGTPAMEALTRLRRGVRLDDGKTAPSRVRVLGRLPTKSWLEVTVFEGRQHLVRRMCAAVGHPVDKLARVRFGPVALGTLPIGAWRELDADEVARLRAAAGLSGGGAGGAGRSRQRARRPRRPPGPPASPPPGGARGRATAPSAARERGRHPRPRSRRPSGR